MYLDNISHYISTGSVFDMNNKIYRKNSIGPLLLTIMLGVVPGVILKSSWIYMTIAMVVISLTSVLTVFIITSKKLTLKKCLYLDTAIFGAWVIELSILECMYFLMWKGFNLWFLLVYAPVILIPLFTGIKIHKSIKSNNFSTKKVAKDNVRTVGIMGGILGMNFAAIFRNADQSITFIVVLLCLVFLNGFMSLGLLSIQKLYYLKKYNLLEDDKLDFSSQTKGNSD